MVNEWVRYNPCTHTYDTPDGTQVAAEIVDNVRCLGDVLYVAQIRARQRKAAQESPIPPAQAEEDRLW